MVKGLAMALALGLGAALAACMPSQGWQRTDERACPPDSPAVLCLSDAHEGPYELRVGERALLPGECMAAPSPDGGGRLRLALHASGRVVSTPAVRVLPGRRTTVEVQDDHERPRVRVVDRQRCDGRIPPP